MSTCTVCALRSSRALRSSVSRCSLNFFWDIRDMSSRSSRRRASVLTRSSIVAVSSRTSCGTWWRCINSSELKIGASGLRSSWARIARNSFFALSSALIRETAASSCSTCAWSLLVASLRPSSLETNVRKIIASTTSKSSTWISSLLMVEPCKNGSPTSVPLIERMVTINRASVMPRGPIDTAIHIKGKSTA